jgi:hypothetical protein
MWQVSVLTFPHHALRGVHCCQHSLHAFITWMTQQNTTAAQQTLQP